jgi:hypothetical protein
MLRKILRIGAWSFAILVAVAAALTALLMFPGFMFAHETRVANLTLHSDSDLSKEAEPVLREIHLRVSSSTVNFPTTEHQIFFGHGQRFFGLIQNARARLVERTLGVKPSLTYNASWPPRISHVITFRAPDFAHGKLVSDKWPITQDMAYLLTHEVAHSLVFERLGLQRAAGLPFWKAEGYPDYVASTTIRRAPGYSLRESVARLLRADLTPMLDATGNLRPLHYDCIGKSYITIETGDYWNSCYYLSRLLIEYQLDRKGLSFDALMERGVIEADTWRELRAAYESGKL